MRTIAPSLNLEPLRAAADEFHQWLGAALFVLAAFAHWIAGAKPDHDFIRRTESQLRKLVFARAALQLGPRRKRAAKRPRNAPVGFRYARNRDSALRALTRNALPKLRALGVRARVARILSVFAQPDIFVARLLKRLRRNGPGARLLTLRPPVSMLAGAAPACTAASADTS